MGSAGASSLPATAPAGRAGARGAAEGPSPRARPIQVEIVIAGGAGAGGGAAAAAGGAGAAAAGDGARRRRATRAWAARPPPASSACARCSRAAATSPPPRSPSRRAATSPSSSARAAAAVDASTPTQRAHPGPRPSAHQARTLRRRHGSHPSDARSAAHAALLDRARSPAVRLSAPPTACSTARASAGRVGDDDGYRSSCSACSTLPVSCSAIHGAGPATRDACTAVLDAVADHRRRGDHHRRLHRLRHRPARGLPGDGLWDRRGARAGRDARAPAGASRRR